MQSAISQGVSIGILLVPHRITTFLMDDGKGKLMAPHRAISSRHPPIPKFNTFVGVKYSFHTLRYLLRLATMESPNRRILGFDHRTTVMMIFNPVRFIKTFCSN